MDPKQTVKLLISATNPEERKEHAENLKAWFDNGGFDNLSPEEHSSYLEALTGEKTTIQRCFGYNDNGMD